MSPSPAGDAFRRDPDPSKYSSKPAPVIAPIRARTGIGSRCGVMKPSMVPATSSISATPTTSVPAQTADTTSFTLRLFSVSDQA